MSLEYRDLRETRHAADPRPDAGVGSDDTWLMRERDTIAELCRRHRVRTILDVGCGALPVLRGLPDAERCEYVGIDAGDEAAWRHRAMYPGRTFIAADLRALEDLDLIAPDLAVCFDVLQRVEDDARYERAVEFLFNCGAKAVALTCEVGEERTNGTGRRHRDFWTHAGRVPLGYVHKTERPFRPPRERILAFDLCEPGVHPEPTEVVYVCSPDREEQLLVSLATVLGSGRSFDRVVVFCVGEKPPHWSFTDPRIVVQQVAPLYGAYFFGNKVYLCRRRASRVVFLDTDTVVMRPLDLVWQDRDADLLGRPGAAYEYEHWNPDLWSGLFRQAGASDVPMFNAGLLVFQHHAHRRIRSEWPRVMAWYLTQALPFPFSDRQLGDQLALALAAGLVGLRCSALGPSEHAYGWRGESHLGAVVWHTGNESFEACVRALGLDTAASAVVRVESAVGRGIEPGVRQLIEHLNARLYDLQHDVARLQRLRAKELARLQAVAHSRRLAAGTLLASLPRIAVALARLDFARASRHAGAVRRSMGRLVRGARHP